MSVRPALPLLLPGCVLLGWVLASREGLVPAYLLPSPGDVWNTLCAYVAGLGGDVCAGRFREDAPASLRRVACGYALAVVPGVFLGLASGVSLTVSRLLSPLINGMKAVPGISWLPLALLWLGVGFRTTVFLIALAGFFPVYLNAAAGARSVPPVLLRAGRMLGLGRAAVFCRVIVPAAMPAVRTGLRVALGMSFSYLVLGELTGVPDGMGAMIMDARMNGRVDLLISGIILIALMGYVCDCLLRLALRLVPGLRQ